jgi:hypothetical protein
LERNQEGGRMEVLRATLSASPGSAV